MEEGRKVLSEGGYWAEKAESPDYARYREEAEPAPEVEVKRPKRKLPPNEKLAERGRKMIAEERAKSREQRVGRARFKEDFTEQELKEMEEKYGKRG